MVGAHVAAKLVQPVKVFATNLADVRATDVVDAAVLGEVGGLAKLFATNITLKRLCASVCAFMHGCVNC